LKPIQINGHSTKLIAFEEQDINDEYLSWLNDAQLMQYSTQRFMQHTHKSALSYLRDMQASSHLFFGIYEIGAVKLIGTITARLDFHQRVADLGILVGNHQYQGRGLGLDAWKSLSNYLVFHEEFRKICAGTLAENVAMNRLALSAGMKLEATLSEQQIYQGLPADVNLYGKLQRDFVPLTVIAR
jgi:RimJ/RimL family protein N-acetyltransferase